MDSNKDAFLYTYEHLNLDPNWDQDINSNMDAYEPSNNHSSTTGDTDQSANDRADRYPDGLIYADAFTDRASRPSGT